ncbi:MAG: hypothetical protein NT150_03460 [Bacteroidetes bacterium]|nr:hypothetical protein [Bacteroidota bacterium]
MRALLFLFLAVLLLSVGCRKDLSSSSWDAHEITPLIKSSLSLDNLLGSDIVSKNPDNSLNVVYKQTLYSANTDSMLKFKDTTFSYGTSLQSLILSDDSVVHAITLGMIARGQGPAGSLILAFQGNSLALPAFNNVSSSDIAVDGGAFFQSMDVLSGFMDITIKNTLPVDISTLDFLLRNDDSFGGGTIASGNFPPIPAGTTQVVSFPLDGKKVYSKMLGKIVTLNTDASAGPVLIDTNNAVTAVIKIRDLKPKTATAFFPDQDVFDQTEGIRLSALSEMMLSEIRVKSGDVKVEVFSSIRDTIFFHYEIPSATLAGVPFEVDTFVPPAAVGQTVSFLYTFPFKDYIINLKGFGIEAGLGKDLNKNSFYDPDTVNTLVQILVGSIKGKNQMVTLALGDTFYVNAGLVSVVPEYAVGYIGDDTLHVGPATVDINMFDKYVSGDLDLEQVKVNFEVKNGFGAKLAVNAKNISSENTKTSNSVVLSNAEMNSTILLDKALDIPLGDSKVTVSDKIIALDKSNSNIKQFIENFPDQVKYEMDVALNPDVPSNIDFHTVLSTPPNFVYNSTGLDATMNIEIPLSMIANDLKLADTVDFSLTKSDQSENFKGGKFHLLTKNGFPFSTNVTIYMLDAANNKIDSLFTNGLIPAAALSKLSGEWKVIEKTSSQISFDVPVSKMENLFSAKKLLLIADFNTAQPNTEYAKVYSDYAIEFLLTGDFDFRVTLK